MFIVLKVAQGRIQDFQIEGAQKNVQAAAHIIPKSLTAAVMQGPLKGPGGCFTKMLSALRVVLKVKIYKI